MGRGRCVLYPTKTTLLSFLLFLVLENISDDYYAGEMERTRRERGGYQTSAGRNQLSYLPYFLINQGNISCIVFISEVALYYVSVFEQYCTMYSKKRAMICL
jgi:hypothetical protein